MVLCTKPATVLLLLRKTIKLHVKNISELLDFLIFRSPEQVQEIAVEQKAMAWST